MPAYYLKVSDVIVTSGTYSYMRTGVHFPLTLLLLTGLIGLSGCGDDIELPDQPVQGTINGDPWVSGGANAFFLPSTGQYLASFISEDEVIGDPCGIPSPGLAHVRAIFRPSIGSFSVSQLAIDNNQVQVEFQLARGITLTANGGFMEIFDINNSVIFGYLLATTDDDNVVEGRFEINICNF